MKKVLKDVYHHTHAGGARVMVGGRAFFSPPSLPLFFLPHLLPFFPSFPTYFFFQQLFIASSMSQSLYLGTGIFQSCIDEANSLFVYLFFPFLKKFKFIYFNYRLITIEHE